MPTLGSVVHVVKAVILILTHSVSSMYMYICFLLGLHVCFLLGGLSGRTNTHTVLVAVEHSYSPGGWEEIVC